VKVVKVVILKLIKMELRVVKVVKVVKSHYHYFFASTAFVQDYLSSLQNTREW
jgi:hypothetical protein